jgi:hypothetical protein
MSLFFKKTVVTFLTFLILFLSISPQFAAAKAADTWYNSGFPYWYTKVFDQSKSPPSEIFGERYTAAQTQWVVYGLLSIPINMITSIQDGLDACIFVMTDLSATNILKCGTATIALATKIATTFVLGGMFAESNDPNANLAQDVFNTDSRELSGINYFKNVASKFSLASPAKAQGFGYTKLGGIQQYWNGFLSMAYSIIVLITIIFAFLIMFKVKLNPQTVITVQSALPKIIGAVILATFSYGIAGLLIDLMYVVSGLFASLMQTAGFAASATKAYAWIVPVTGPIATSFTIFWFMLSYAIMFALAVLWSIISIFGGNLVFFGIFGTLVGLVFMLLWLWVVILMVVYAIRIPWVLLKNLISIYMSIVVAPLQIVVGSLVPSFGFTQWLKKLIAELLVFPVTGLFMFLAWRTLIHSFSVNLTSPLIAQGMAKLFGVTLPPPLWAPEIIGSTGSMSGLIWIAMSFTLIALLPKVIDIMKAVIMGERFSFDNAIGEARGPLTAIWAGTGGAIGAAYARNKAQDFAENYKTLKDFEQMIRDRLPRGRPKV